MIPYSRPKCSNLCVLSYIKPHAPQWHIAIDPIYFNTTTITKSERGTWDVGTRGLGDAGMWEPVTWGRGDSGTWYARTSELGDVLNNIRLFYIWPSKKVFHQFSAKVRCYLLITSSNPRTSASSEVLAYHVSETPRPRVLKFHVSILLLVIAEHSPPPRTMGLPYILPHRDIRKTDTSRLY